MPLPRFHRLETQEQLRILDVARRHFAAHGRDGASLNAIIAEAGISKTSAYHYFDGKDDVFGAVVEVVVERLAATLGPWTLVTSPQEFWQQFTDSSQRLSTHLAQEPADRAVLAEVARGGHADALDPWWDAALDSARDLGLISTELDRSLVADASRAVLAAVDAWSLERPAVSATDASMALRSLLSAIWRAPNDPA